MSTPLSILKMNIRYLFLYSITIEKKIQVLLKNINNVHLLFV